jgi:murein DD-endopeptidase MepM/ murein hydrolase activator NlpD
MKKFSYTTLLYFLRGLIYLKRALLSSLGFLWQGICYLERLFRGTIGFRLYKMWLVIKKVLPNPNNPWYIQTIEFLGRRATLQVLFFLICCFILFPHSRFYVRDANKIAGQETLLYAILGPGYQDFSLEEVNAATVDLDSEASAVWREGSVQALSPSTVGVEQPVEVQEISSISAGGSAISKPTILPGVSLPSAAGIMATGRTEIVYYEVQSGDVIGEIAEKYGISVNTILWANNLTARSYIRPGDKLKILPADGLIHLVKKGDTVSKIAKTYSAETEDIIKFNGLQEDGSDIVVGESLIVPGGKKPQPVYSYTVPSSQSFRSISAPPASVNAPAGSGYLWPTGVRRISQYFGWRHTGLDIAGPKGTAIYAARDGEVIKSQCGWNGGYGCYIIIDHGGGVKTLYGHASELYVSVGDYVSQGQSIMAMGSTGRSTGPHLHFEVTVNGGKQNPLKYIR